MHEAFRKFANITSAALGTPWAFGIAFLSILIWAAAGPIFHFSDTWQLWANTGTTLVTFLMVFLIQNTQNRDAKAIHLKLDELIRAMQGARNSMVDLEELTDAELAALEKQFRKLHQRAQDHATGQALEAVESELDERHDAHADEAHADERPAAVA